MQLDAVLLSLFHRVDGSSSFQTLVVDIGDDQQAGLAVAVDGVVDRTETHGANGCQQSHLAAFDDAHLVLIGAGLSMVHSMEGTDDTGDRLSQRAVEISIGVVGQQVVGQQGLDGDQTVLGIAAAVLVGIAGGQLGALVEVGGLDGEAVAGLILVLPVLADLFDDAAELVAHDGGVLSAVIGNALVVGTLDSSLVGAHADRVGHDLDEDIVRTDLRQFDLLKAKVHLTVDSYSFGLHIRNSSFLLCRNRVSFCVGLYLFSCNCTPTPQESQLRTPWFFAKTQLSATRCKEFVFSHPSL